MAQSSTITQRIALTGATEIAAQLKNLGATGEAAVKQITEATAASGSGWAKLSEGVAGAKASLGTLGESVGALGEKFSGLTGILTSIAPELGALAGAGAGAALLALASGASNATRELENTAAALGLTTDQWESMSFALGSTGADMSAMQSHMARMMASIGQAREAFEKLDAASGHLAATQQFASQTADLTRRSADLAGDAAASGVDKLKTAINSSQLEANKAKQAFETLNNTVAKTGETADQARAAHEKLVDAQAAMLISTQKLRDSQTSLLDGVARASIAADNARLQQQKQAEAIDETARAAEAAVTPIMKFYKEVGVIGTAEEPTGEALYKIVDGLNAITDKSKVAALAMKIWSRSWVEMEPIIRIGSGALRASDQAFEATGLALTEGEKDLAAAYSQSWNNLSRYLEAVRNIVGNGVGQIFTPIFKGISDWISKNQELIRSITQSFVDGAIPVMKLFYAVFEAGAAVVAPVVKVFVAGFDGLAEAFNYVFGTHATGGMIAWQAVFAVMAYAAVAGLGAIAVAAGTTVIAFAPFLLIAAAVAAVAIVMITQWDGMVSFLKTAWEGFGKIFTAIGGAIGAAWDAVTTKITDIWDGAVGLVKSAWQSLSDWFSGQIDEIVDFFAPLVKVIEKVISLMKSASTEAPGDAAAIGGATGGMAGGGPVYGAGTATSDSIPARLSNGEFVMRASAVQKYGLGLMAAFNSLRAPLANFSLGGFVSRLTGLSPPRLALAGGGAVIGQGSAGQRPINLTILGQTFGVKADQDVADGLVRVARSQALHSAGPKPSWYRG